MPTISVVRLNMDLPPVVKKAKRMNNSEAYVPLQEGASNGDGVSNFSLFFSLKEQKGELARSLQPFQVSIQQDPLLPLVTHWVVG